MVLYTPLILVLLASPLILLSRMFIGSHKEEKQGLRELSALLALSLFLYQYGMASLSLHWTGGPSYAYRILVPVLPLLLFPFHGWMKLLLRGERKTVTEKGIIAGITLLTLLSLGNTLYAVTNLNSVYNAPPFFNLSRPRNSLLYEKIRYGGPRIHPAPGK